MARKKRSSGEGSIYFSKAQKLWVAELVLPDGKKKRKRSKRQSVVRDWLEREKEAVRRGVWVSGAGVQYGDFLDRYLSEVAAHTLKPITIVSYTHHIRAQIKPALGDLKLSILRPDHLQRFYSDLLNSGLGKTTVRYIHSIVRKTLSIALQWGLVGRNVAEAVKPPKPDPYEIKPLTVGEVKKLLHAVEGDRLYAFYVLISVTGIRKGEALALQKSDLDLSNGTVSIRKTLNFIAGKGVVLGEPKSEKSNREIALPEFAVNVLKRHLSVYSLNSNFVFSTSRGTPFSPRNILRHFKSKLAEAGLPAKTRIHDLRHSYISWLIQSGQDIKTIQTIAGHAQIQITLDTYGHLMPGALRSAADKVEKMFAD